MKADLMLAWMSETGSGDVLELRQRVAWLARNADRSPTRYQVGRWLRDLASLGHAEIDWERRRWAAAPSVGILLPACGGTAAIAGRRSLHLVRRLEAEDVAVQVVRPEEGADGSLPPPNSVYVQADSVAQLEAAFERTGIRYCGYVAARLADALPPLALGAPAAQPAWETAVEHLSVRDGFQLWTGRADGDGLCRITVHGRPRYLYRRGRDWLHTDLAQGILWTLAERGVGVIRWRREHASDNQEIGTVFVDQGVPLPPLQARALVLCSGLAPQIGSTTRTAIYRNVPRAIADRVAVSIRQRITVID